MSGRMHCGYLRFCTTTDTFKTTRSVSSYHIRLFLFLMIQLCSYTSAHRSNYSDIFTFFYFCRRLDVVVVYQSLIFQLCVLFLFSE